MILQPKFIQINISNACNSRCPGCPITLSQRSTAVSMSEDDFYSIVNLSIPFIASNPLHLQLGIGNTLLVYSSLIKYIDILSAHPRLASDNITIEISVTLLSADDRDTLEQLFKHINNTLPHAKIIIECIISPTITVNDFNIVENNISYIKSVNIEMHIICRYTNGLKRVGDSFINMVENSPHIELLTIDFFFRDQSVGSKYTYVDFEDWCISNYKNPLLDYPLNDNFSKKLPSASDDFVGIYFDSNLIPFPLLTTPFGDMILPEPISRVADFMPASILPKIKRLSFPSQNPICKKCSFYDSCPSHSINSMHNFMDIPITINSCFFGKKLLNFIQAGL